MVGTFIPNSDERKMADRYGYLNQPYGTSLWTEDMKAVQTYSHLNIRKFCCNERLSYFVLKNILKSITHHILHFLYSANVIHYQHNFHLPSSGWSMSRYNFISFWKKDTIFNCKRCSLSVFVIYRFYCSNQLFRKVCTYPPA